MRTVSNTSLVALASASFLSLAAACGDSDGTTSGTGGATGTGGGATTGATTGAGGDASTTATTGSSTSATTGAGGMSGCPTALYAGTSCEGFLAGCYEPDTSGVCSDMGTSLTWSDGHKIQRVGGTPGLYGPNDASPCITLVFDAGTNTATLTKVATGDVLTNQDLGGGLIKITCPDGEVIDTNPVDTNADNVCRGVACP